MLIPNNGGALVVEHGSDQVAGVAADGVYDNVEVVGQVITRTDQLGHPMNGLLIAVLFKAVLTAVDTLTLKNLKVYHDSVVGMGTEALFETVEASEVLATGAAGGSTERGVFQRIVDLSGAKEFIRIKYTPDCSAGGADTFQIVAVPVFFGGNVEPAV